MYILLFAFNSVLPPKSASEPEYKPCSTAVPILITSIYSCPADPCSDVEVPAASCGITLGHNSISDPAKPSLSKSYSLSTSLGTLFILSPCSVNQDLPPVPVFV